MSLPEGTLRFNHQVAGHQHVDGKNVPGMLKHLDGSVLKPVFKDDRGMRELNFYKNVYQSTNETDIALQKFLPKFLGIYSSTFCDKEYKFMKLEDITNKFSKPCILDVKMGPRTYDDFATPEKIKKEISKYPPVKEIGFRILGTRIFKKDKNEFEFKDKDYFKTLLTRSHVINALNNFFSSTTNKRLLLHKLLIKLESLNDVMSSQSCYVFYASSILISYDSEASRQEDENDIEVKMIDFAHVFKSSEIDSNYIFGLQRFIDCIKNILQTCL